jgi:hypothetical protein
VKKSRFPGKKAFPQVVTLFPQMVTEFPLAAVSSSRQEP